MDRIAKKVVQAKHDMEAMGHAKQILAPPSLGLNYTKVTHMKLGHPLV